MTKAEVILLVEDRQQLSFLLRLLRSLGFNPRQFRHVAPPAGKSGGVAHVLSRYAQEVREHRRRAARLLSRRLLVMIDADEDAVDRRLSQLDERLASDGQERRSADERLVLLVPRRNIETWIHWLEGNPVDEGETYPRYTEEERRCQESVDRLVALIHSQAPLPPDCPPSLQRGIEEIRQRLLRA